jgi:signal transduction histidine kinase
MIVTCEDITTTKQAQEELARLTDRALRLKDEERRFLARGLHDTTAQNLLAVTLNVTRLRKQLGAASPAVDSILDETLTLAEQSLQEVRTLSYLCHPPLLASVGLGPALLSLGEGFSERSGIKVDVMIGDGVDGIRKESATALFHVAQECLANVYRHSGSPWARIDLQRAEGALRLEVTDGGCGLPPRVMFEGPAVELRAGGGLSGIRARLEQLQGRLEIVSGPTGTRLAAVLPLARGPESSERILSVLQP